nr:toll/interleukin-1 receptor domain-containing protein [Eubacterium sp. MSJ-13]
MKYEIEEKVFLDNIAKWKIYNRKSDFSKNQHVNDIFKEYLIIALGLDSIDKAKIPLDKDVEDRPYVFISYSNEDYKKVYPVLAKLKEDGISFWYDAGLYYGDSWNDQVGNRMDNDNCKGIVFFSSENSFASCNINKEIKKAYDLCKDPESKKKYFAVSLLNVEKTTAILKEAMCKMNQYDLGKNWGTKEIEIIIKAFPDEATVVKTNEVGWLEKIESTIRRYVEE